MQRGALGSLGDTTWLDVLNTGITDASKILGSRYAVPQLNAGQYIQNSQGIMYQLGAGQTNALFPGASSLGGSSTTLLLFGGAALLLVLLVAKR